MGNKKFLEWLERRIDSCLNDKDLQREHWAFCKAYKKYIECIAEEEEVNAFKKRLHGEQTQTSGFFPKD